MTPIAAEILETGVLYISGRDKQMRPILHMEPQNFIKLELDKRGVEDPNDEMLKATVFLMEFMKNHLWVSGKVESFVVMINMNIGITQCPFGVS